MKKLYILLFCFAFMLIAACSSSRPPTAEKIREDLNASPDILPWVDIQNVEIVRSRTDETNNSMTADITFTGVDEYANYTGTMTLLYNLYDNGKWMIDSSEIEYNCELTKLFEVDMESIDNSSVFQAHYMTDQIVQKYNFLSNCKNSLGVESYWTWAGDWDNELNESASVDIICMDYSFTFDGTTATLDLLCDAQYPYMDVYFEAIIRYDYIDGSWFFSSVDNIDFQVISFKKLEGKTFHYGNDVLNYMKIESIDVYNEVIEIEYYDDHVYIPEKILCSIMLDPEAISTSDAIQEVLESGYLYASCYIETSLESRFDGYVEWIFLRNIQFVPFVSIPRTTWADFYGLQTDQTTTHDFFLE